MQALSLISTDMMTSGSATGASSAQAGQEEAGFTAHLAKAAAKQSSSYKHTGSSAKEDKEPVNDASQAEKGNAAAAMTQVTDGSTTSDTAEDNSTAAAVTAATVYPSAIFFQWTAAQAAGATVPTGNQAHKAATVIDRILSAVTLPGASKSMDLAALPAEGQAPVAADATNKSLLDTNAAQTPVAVQGEAETTAPAPVAPQAQTALSFTSSDPTTPPSTATMATIATTANAGKGIEQAATGSMTAGKSIEQAATGSMTAGETLAGTGAPANAQGTPSPTSVIQQNGVEHRLGQIVQNEYSQIITIHQAARVEEKVDAPVGSEKDAASLKVGDSRQDVSNSYMHARLPGESPLASKDGDKGQQKEAGGEQQKNTPAPEAATSGQSQAEQLLSPKNQVTLNQESQPLIFAHHRDAASVFASGNTSTATSTDSSSLLRLPSGLVVPEGTVIDQMITRFSMNQRLESSSINLTTLPAGTG